MEIIARGTTGFSGRFINTVMTGVVCCLVTSTVVVLHVGADLANLINQAALHGSAAGNVAVTADDIDFARDKIIMGPERKSAVIEEKNKRLVAYHEGGHAIVALFTPGNWVSFLAFSTQLSYPWLAKYLGGVCVCQSFGSTCTG